MSLINCPECGKEISDKAANCPNCGLPLNPHNNDNKNSKEDEEYLCCPKCMSKELHAEHKGFRGGKALTGAVLVGGIGLLAGSIGSKDVQITCLKCGNIFKAGDAKIVKKGRSADDLENRILYLLCEGDTIGAQLLYKSETHCSDQEASSYIYKLIEKVPERSTPEQTAKRQKYYENIKNNKSGCLGLFIFLILSTVAFIYII